jgi:hypothetical protein
MARILFKPCAVLATADALQALQYNEVTPQCLLGRHMAGDWGEWPALERRRFDLHTLAEQGTVTSRFRLADGELVLVTTNLNQSDTLISQPGDDKHLARFAQAWRHPVYDHAPPGFPYYLVPIVMDIAW